MPHDAGTIAFYDENAAAYAEEAPDAADLAMLERFMELLPAGGTVCDLGSGSGWASVVMRDAGFDVTPVDGSAGLAAEAKRRHGLNVRVMRFDQLDFADAFDGVWAGWSLHHVEHALLPGVLKRVSRALRPAGILMVAVKGGTGEKRDTLKRFYSYHDGDTLEALLRETVGVEPVERIESELAGYDASVTPCISLLTRRMNDAH